MFVPARQQTYTADDERITIIYSIEQELVLDDVLDADVCMSIDNDVINLNITEMPSSGIGIRYEGSKHIVLTIPDNSDIRLLGGNYTIRPVKTLVCCAMVGFIHFDHVGELNLQTDTYRVGSMKLKITGQCDVIKTWCNGQFFNAFEIKYTRAEFLFRTNITDQLITNMAVIEKNPTYIQKHMLEEPLGVCSVCGEDDAIPVRIWKGGNTSTYNRRWLLSDKAYVCGG
jgi:hypothetical protein